MKIRSFRELSLKRKITFLLTISTAAALLIVSLGFLAHDYYSYRRELLNNLISISKAIGVNSTSALLFHDAKSAEETLSALSMVPSIDAGYILTKDREIFSRFEKTPPGSPGIENGAPTSLFPPAGEGSEQSRESHYRILRNHLHLLQPILLQGEVIGYIRLQANLNELYAHIKRVAGLMILITLGAWSLAFWLGKRFQKILTDPILMLLQKMKFVSREKNYTVRAAKAAGDEVGDLVDGFNSMLEQIQIRDEKLNKSRDDLASEVAQRTEDLVLANQSLERLVADLRAARDAAETASRVKSEFLANMSHELRTPLNHIIGFTELVSDGQAGGLNEAQQEYLGDALKSSRHLLSLINDILDLSKIEAGKMQLDIAEVPIRPLLENSFNMVSEKALKQGIQFLEQIDGIPETILADERKLKQILYNLLGNAVKFTPEGGRIVLTARALIRRKTSGAGEEAEGARIPLPEGADGNWLEIAVEDTGIGVKQEDLQRIFSPFEQADGSASRKFQGTGLGLSLARQIVELHGGAIWAESEGEGKGSKFVFVLPFVPPA